MISIANIINSLVETPVPIYVCREGLANEYTASNLRLLEEIRVEELDIYNSIKLLIEFYTKAKNKIDIYFLLYQ